MAQDSTLITASSGDNIDCYGASTGTISVTIDEWPSGRTIQFYVENDGVFFVNNALSNFASVRFYYYLRPNRLVLEKDSCKITNINRTTGVISVNNIPTDFSSLPKIDFIANKTPNKIISFDISITSISANTNPKTITLPAAKKFFGG